LLLYFVKPSVTLFASVYTAAESDSSEAAQLLQEAGAKE
jgi:hypothetical protein